MNRIIMLKKVHTDKAPAAIAHYSQAVVFDRRIIYCSAQVGMKPGTFQLVSDDVLEQAKQIFENIKAILEEAGSGLDKVMKVDIFLTNMNYFAAVNELYSHYFTSEPYPARQTVEVVKLPRGASMSMSCVAYVEEEKLVNSASSGTEY